MCDATPASTETMPQTTGGDTQRPRSHLFMVRVWQENLGDGKTEWRGQVKHVLSGEARYFREWPTLLEYLREMSLKNTIDLVSR
jgi:hypothetical protein